MQEPNGVSCSGAPVKPEQLFRNNIPAPLTSLIGREQEVLAACALLRRADVHLLTLTGTGGIGKTRLGLQVATVLTPDFAHGIYFVPLAPLSDPSLVLPTIAHTLGVGEERDYPLFEQLTERLREKHLLIVLDNFEQVAAAALQVAALLAACPTVKALVTSRAVLRVSGEQEFPVPPLTLPDPQHLPDITTLSRSAAVALFVQRVQAIKPDFQLTDANAPAIVEISLRLDGLPLAIELAAARIKLLSPAALLARLEHRLEVLTSGSRDMPERQHTLRNTMTWSYDLLGAEEQQLFRRLSVFVGGCTLEAVEAVCHAGSDEAVNVLDAVTSLLDNSLLAQVAQERGESRLVMLETIREYGLERLVASGEKETTRCAHAEYYLKLAERVEPELQGPRQDMWLHLLEREHDNLRAALRWLIEQGGVEDVEKSWRLASALGWFWMVRGHVDEGRQWLASALCRSEWKLIAASVRGKTLNAAGLLAYPAGDYAQAVAFGEESLAVYRELGDKRGIALSLIRLGLVALSRHNHAEARPLIEEALGLFKEVGDRVSAAYALDDLAQTTVDEGEYAETRSLLEEGLAIMRECGDKWGTAYLLLHLADVLFFQGDYTKAQAQMQESLALYREVDDKSGIIAALSFLAAAATFRGGYLEARSLLEEGLIVSKEARTRTWPVYLRLFLARVASLQGNDAEAYKLIQESFATFRAQNGKWGLALCLEVLGEMGAARGQGQWAAQLFGAAEAVLASIGVSFLHPLERAFHERAVGALHAQLGEGACAAAWAEGQAMTLEEVAQAVTSFSAQGNATVSKQRRMVTGPNYPAELTVREVEVLRLVAEGLTDAQVAERLVLSPRTVSTHLTSIYNKLGVTSRAAAARLAFDHHLI